MQMPTTARYHTGLTNTIHRTEGIALLRTTSAVSLMLLLIASFPDEAQATVCSALSAPRHDFQLLAGYSPVSSTWIGRTEDRKFVLAGFTYSYRCWKAREVGISYTTGVFPVAALLQPAMPNFRASTPRIIPEHAVYGVGVLPVGFTAHFGRHAIQPFFEMRGGMIASTEPVPINAPDSTGLNFLFDVGPGMRFKVGDHHAVSMGYKFLHISNAYTANFNPGVDNNVIFVGLSVLR